MSSKALFSKVISSYKWENNLLECATDNGMILRVEVYHKDIIRIRYASRPFFPKDFSYGVDPEFNKDPGTVQFDDKDDALHITTTSILCSVRKKDARISFFDRAGNCINQDEKGVHFEKEESTGNDIVKMSKKNFDGELYFGLGDKPMSMNLKGRKVENWGTDSYGYVKDSDPLYKNIPFYYGLHDGIGYGIFFDNSFRTFFDFGAKSKEVTRFWAKGGEMNYYFIAGPELTDVTRRYALLTGTPDMPALWSLGFQQCKWSYYPENEVRDVAAQMRTKSIPCDAIYLDIDYMDGFRCFTWDKERFPDPEKMVSDLKKEGFKTVVIIDPGIKIDPEYQVFQEALSKDFFCKRLDGPYAEGKVWPGDCYFPDFTKPEVREWWSDLYRELIAEIGIAGVWNDMNEPALFEVESKTMPDDVLFDYDGHLCSHRKAHNVYGMQMARATYEGVKKYGANKRGLIISRSGYSGLQRFSSVWTGDNLANWQHIWIANIQCQRLAISGISFAGSDIGGFIGQPTPEMFVRWIQLAIFHPFCRVHSSQDDGDQEPWSFGTKTLDLFREAIELRYRMLPYHYTAFYKHYRYGDPILKPIVFYDQLDDQTHSRDHEFICGDHILTRSIDSPEIKELDVYLPKGQWYNYWSDELFLGGGFINQSLTEATFPFFIKAGTVLTLYPVQQYVGALDFKQVDLHIYYLNGQLVSHLYEDAHDGYEYENGAFRWCQFTVNGSDQTLTVAQDVEGDYFPNYAEFNLVLHGFPAADYSIELDGQSSAATIPITFKELKISW